MIINSYFIGILFDGYRVLKGRIRLPSVLVFIIDVFFGVFAAIFTFNILLKLNNGQLRLSIFIIFLLGLWSYYKTVSIWFVSLWDRIYKSIILLWQVLTTIFSWTIVKPVKIIYQLTFVIVTFLVGAILWVYQLIKGIFSVIFKKAIYVGVTNGKKIIKKIGIKEGISSFFKKLFKH